jgi:hypothetical protein
MPSQGVDLGDLATIGAQLTSYMHEDEVQRLLSTFDFMGLDPYVNVSLTEVDEVVHAYMLLYLYAPMADMNELSTDRQGVLEMRQALMEEKAASWVSAEKFLKQTLHSSIAAVQPALLMGNMVDFEAVTEIVADVDSKYATYINSMCNNLKWALLAKEDRVQGRIKLGDFYRIGRDGDWKLSEKDGYLREIGTLDESGESPSVIVPNYMGALTNCHHVSPFYSLCCKNECNALMEKIEEEIGAAVAMPSRILEVVTALGSDSVHAPRELSAKLAERLNNATHEAVGGKVPIHGRLFAQWLHHAFPNECPYPHARGTWSYRHPEEWSEEQGFANVAATEEEIEHYCQVDKGLKEGDEMERDIPWSSEEELLIQLGSYDLASRPLLITSPSLIHLTYFFSAAGVITAIGRSRGALDPIKI